jgi:hypothetical protein
MTSFRKYEGRDMPEKIEGAPTQERTRLLTYLVYSQEPAWFGTVLRPIEMRLSLPRV